MRFTTGVVTKRCSYKRMRSVSLSAWITSYRLARGPLPNPKYGPCTDQDVTESCGEISCDHGISVNTFYVWKCQHAGMDTRDVRLFRELEAE